MSAKLPRRRFLAISAAASVATGASSAPNLPEARWQGAALGSKASITLSNIDALDAQPLFQAVEAELNRLENIFSLYRPESSISRLNRDGKLSHPPADLLEVLSLCDALHGSSEGAFDPTVQPVFETLAKAAAAGRVPDPAELSKAHARTGWRHLRYDSLRIRHERPGAKITLNGIAQGYITDRVATLLESFGMRDVLIDAGEIAALGHCREGQAWRVGIADTEGITVKRLSLSDRALATSAPLGTLIDPATGTGHIFDPTTAGTANGARLISVSAPSAALADGLSTALCVVEPTRRADILEAFPRTRLEAAL